MIRNRLFAVLTLGIALVLSACGGGSTTPVNPTDGTVVSGKDGGTVKGPDGVQVVIPPGALPADTKITIKKSSAGAPPSPEGFKLGTGGDIYEITPHGVTFSSPVTIRLPLPAGATDPLVYVSEPDTGWYPQATKVVNGFVEVQRTGFSWYRITSATTNTFRYDVKTGISVPSVECDPTSTNGCIWLDDWVLKQNVPASAEFQAFFTDLGANKVTPLPDCKDPKVGMSVRADGTQVWIPLPAETMSVGNYTSPVGIAGTASLRTLSYTPPIAGKGSAYFTLFCNGNTEFNKALGIKINFTVLPTYAVKGSVSGLPAGKTVELSNAGKTVSSGGSFEFLGLDSGAAYNVTVSKQPEGYNCTVSSNGKGTMGSADVTGVAVTCESTAPKTYAVGGTVSGLPNGGSVVLKNNGGDAKTVGNGPFTFATKLLSGASYSVSVDSSPAHYTCTTGNTGSGTIGSADVNTVAVTCTEDAKYTVGGSVSGLAEGASITISNGSNTMSSGNGSFTLPGSFYSGTAYNVSVSDVPAHFKCDLGDTGSGNIGNANVGNVAVTCTEDPKFKFTLSVSGLPQDGKVDLKFGILTLSFGNGDVSEMTYAPFEYNITVSKSPAHYTCEVANGTGTITDADVTVTITCTEEAKYTVGGTISGLDPQSLFDTAQLQLNGGESFYKRNGSFVFTTQLYQGDTYTVSIPSQGNSTCEITGGTGTIAQDGLSISGTMGSVNISDIVVTCAPPTGNGGPYNVSGMVQGLPGGSEYTLTLTLAYNGNNENITVNFDDDPNFDFQTDIAEGGSFQVTASQATGQNGAPTMSCGASPSSSSNMIADVTVNVICSPGGPPGP